MRRLAHGLLAALAMWSAALPCAAQELVIASKSFTENRILAEIVKQLIEARTELSVRHADSLGGTMICWEALLAGEVDLYVEYTGTAWAVILKEEGKLEDPLQAFLQVQQRSRELHDVHWMAPFGLNNTYALALRREKAEELGVRSISDLAGHGAELNVAFSIEVMQRADGWPGLREHYPGLDLEPRGMEHGLAYGALARGQIDLVDAYSTDGKLLRYDVLVLEDDLRFFPPYNAAALLRGETLRAHPELQDVLWELAFAIDDAGAMALNYRVEVDGEDFAPVARSFLAARGLLTEDGASPTKATPRGQRGLFSVLWTDRSRIFDLLIEHALLVAIAVSLACALALPMGILITRYRRLRGFTLGSASVMQTIPSLALLAFLIAVPGLGLGARSAIVALVLYAVLPILRNTCTGLDSIDPALVEAARGLGLTPRQVLLRIQLPLASRTIMAGLRTATVICVGVATLAAFIGAGGLGQPIIEGLYLNDMAVVLSGAVPAALLALLADAGLGWLEQSRIIRE